MLATGEKDYIIMKKKKSSTRKVLKSKKKSIPKLLKKNLNRRQRKRNAALDPRYNLKIRQELIDYDYLNKLDEKERAWLNKFTEEYTNASFNTDKPLHKTKKRVKDCYTRNNHRNVCILGKAKANNNLQDIDKAFDLSTSEEDRLNAKLDLELLGYTDDNGYDRRKRRKKNNKFRNSRSS